MVTIEEVVGEWVSDPEVRSALTASLVAREQAMRELIAECGEKLGAPAPVLAQVLTNEARMGRAVCDEERRLVARQFIEWNRSLL